MEAFRVQQVITKTGEVLVTGLPYEKGHVVEIIVFPRSGAHVCAGPYGTPPQPLKTISHSRLTVRRLRQSGLIGLWEDRDDIQDSAAYARRLREQAQKRGDINYDFVG